MTTQDQPQSIIYTSAKIPGRKPRVDFHDGSSSTKFVAVYFGNGPDYIAVYSAERARELATAFTNAAGLLDPAPGHASGCVRFVRPGRVAPDRPVPDRCVACGQPEAAHPVLCDVDWGSATPSQRCTLPAGHLSKHVDGTGGWAPEPAPAPGIDLGDDPDGDNTPEDDLAALLAASHECYWCGWHGTGMRPCMGFEGKWECADAEACRRRSADDAPLTGCVRCGASGVPLVSKKHEPGLVCSNSVLCAVRQAAKAGAL